MAKEDFCYTHYDGDEARDLAHMNRLERGAYTDVRLAQRKFGHLTIDRIKKILSKDFDEVWDSVEAVLSVDDKGNYYIGWLDNSVNKMRAHSSHQSINGKKGGRPKNENPNETQLKANQNPNNNLAFENETQKKPLEDGDEYDNEYKLLEYNNIKVTNGEHKLLVNDLTEDFANKCYAFLSSYKIEKKYETESDYLTIRRWVVAAVKKHKNGTDYHKRNNHHVARNKGIGRSIEFDKP